VQAWLTAAEISAGPVFRAVGRGGRISCEALANDSAARIVKRMRAGSGSIPPPTPATACARHKSLDILRGYVRWVDLFKEHAGAAFL
jgi:hypothetical protein